MSKFLRDYTTDLCHLAHIDSLNKWSDQDIECAKSWLPIFKEKLPDINWTLNISLWVTITDGEFHFIVGENGCLYMIMCKGTLKAGHIFEMGKDWAANLFKEPYNVNYSPEWANFFTEHRLEEMYQRKLENNRRYKTEYAIAESALEEFKLENPYAEIVVFSSDSYYFPEIKRDILIRPCKYEDQYYKRHLDGSWYSLDDSDPDNPEWYPCTITGEIDMRKERTHFPQWF